ncbi:MAG: glycosyltransferase family 4 protein [Deltaproteobacteria bacterium]|nr:glycosyltransferase family 4 protein [Deltaproteobacteria bacterium]
MSIRVLLDARKLGDGGVGVYIENLINGYLELGGSSKTGVDFSLLLAPHVVAEQSEVGEYVRECLAEWGGEVDFLYDGAKKYSFSEYFLLPLRKQKILKNHSLYHSPHYTLPFFLGIPSIITVHDVIHVSHPDSFYHRPVARKLISSALRRASRVITVSRYSQSQIKKYFADCHTPIVVVPNALRKDMLVQDEKEMFASSHTNGLASNYLLFVGNGRPHKNLASLLKAFHKLKNRKAEGGSLGVDELVIVGEWDSSASCSRIISRRGLVNCIRTIKAPTTRELCALYKNARAVVIPSLEEGFSLVALEAMAAGTPVICTPLTALKELCGEHAWYSSGARSRDLLEALLRALADEKGCREKICKSLARARLFNRGEVVRRTIAVYESALSLDSLQSDEVFYSRRASG